MDFFGFEDRIIDNVLEQKERKLFYLLHNEGILRTQREEITLPNGRRWRIHYWILKKQEILRFIKNLKTEENVMPIPINEQEDIYSCLSGDIWSSRSGAPL